MIEDITVWIAAVQLFFIALMLLFSYLVARYGVEHFNKVFASITLATGFAYAILLKSTGLDTLWGVDISSLHGNATFYWGFVLAMSALLLFLGRFLSYIAIFGLLTILIIVLTIYLRIRFSNTPVLLLGVEPNPALMIGSAIASLAITVLTRRHSIKVLVGVTSGLYFSTLPYFLASLALSKTLVSALPDLNYENASLATKTYIVIFIAMPLIFAGLGIALQYFWHERLFGSAPNEEGHK